MLHVAYRPPYGFAKLLDFFRMRQLEGVELVDDVSYSRTVRIASASGGKDAVGWICVRDEPEKCRLAVCASESLLPVVSQISDRIRRQFDTDSDPLRVYEGIRSLDELVPGSAVCGTRVPGAFDSFEIAVRAVLGQQVSVAAANKLAARIVAAYGTPIDAGVEGLGFLFPTAQELLSLDPIEDALGRLGVIKARSRAIRELARLSIAGGLDFGPGSDAVAMMDVLLAIRGIGPWSANYIAMRAFGYADAFLEKDAGIKHALPALDPKERLVAAEKWRPWRAYANLCLWNSLS